MEYIIEKKVAVRNQKIDKTWSLLPIEKLESGDGICVETDIADALGKAKAYSKWRARLKCACSVKGLNHKDFSLNISGTKLYIIKK